MLRDEPPDNTLAPLSIDVLGPLRVRLGDAELSRPELDGAGCDRCSRCSCSKVVRRERISDLFAHGRQQLKRTRDLPTQKGRGAIRRCVRG